jgi:hypothetical protein
MKNITLAVEDDVLSAVRKYAAERSTTVNGLVRDYLMRLATQEDKAAAARAKLVELSRDSDLGIGEITWKREDLHERAVFSGHEYSGLRGFTDSGRSEESDGR